MRVSHLSLTSWRNYERAELQLPAGITVLLGRNGQGKTNLVEAIGYLSTLSSHRVAQNNALIRAVNTASPTTPMRHWLGTVTGRPTALPNMSSGS